MGGRECRNCDRTRDAGVYCQNCADEIMARVLNPHHGGRKRKAHRPVAATQSAHPRLIG